MKMQETKLVDPHLLDPAQTGLEAQEFEARLRSKVVGQDDAIRQVVRVYQTFSLGMSIPGRPVGCFLFLGPTGTGKTRLVEAAAESAAGDARSLIKIDCGEFQHSHEIAKLTGSPPGYLGHRDTHPLLSQEALDRFHTQDLRLSFVLFDEIEKASDALWNLLLGILDKATLHLGDNRRVDFSNTMIFMTGNIGAAEMSKELTHRFGFAPTEFSPSRTRGIAVEAARRRFPPDFFNRIDKLVVFQTLGEKELLDVLDLEVKTLSRRFANHTRFLLTLTEAVKGYLLREGTDVRYGARHLKRVVERSLVDPLCNLMATGQVRSCDEIRVDLDKEGQQMMFYRDKENVELPDIPAITSDAATEAAPSGPITEPVSTTPPIAAWCCF
jgi:ATP-dependent Clp protease ATP-binding subunit ClpA